MENTVAAYLRSGRSETAIKGLSRAPELPYRFDIVALIRNDGVEA
jgi:hypothetical protein